MGNIDMRRSIIVVAYKSLCKGFFFIYILFEKIRYKDNKEHILYIFYQHMGKKLFRGILWGILWFWLVYLYFLSTGNASILRTWIQSYPLYTVIFFVSLLTIYILQWGKTIAKFLVSVIILINVFILWDVFFRNNIGLNSEQFITLFGLIVLALVVMRYIQHWIRYLLMIIIWLAIVFVLLTGILPLYEKIPSVTDFIQWQKVKIISQWTDSQGSLRIKDVLGTKEIAINDIKGNILDLSHKTQISFISKTKTGEKKIFVDLGNGSFINISPQSAITLEQTGDQTIMEIIQGDISYYTPVEFSGTIRFIGKYTGKNIENTENTVRSAIINQFEQKKEDFFIKELWGAMIFNPSVDKIIRFFISTLSRIHPDKYQKNLSNYVTIHQYFGRPLGETTNSTTTGENMRSIINDIFFQIKKWSEETTIIKQLLGK